MDCARVQKGLLADQADEPAAEARKLGVKVPDVTQRHHVTVEENDPSEFRGKNPWQQRLQQETGTVPARATGETSMQALRFGAETDGVHSEARQAVRT